MRSRVERAVRVGAISAALLLTMPVSGWADSGGPDDWGYVWHDSAEPDGPRFEWVDITETGTLVTGLADDNSVGPLSMEMTFPFYWREYDQLGIGSNGYLVLGSFAGNVAHCFPPLPSSDEPQSLIAPFMSDLNFDDVGNPGEVYYLHDAPNERFIISYVDVPYWIAAVPSYTGSSTFQVLLYADGTIVYQYLRVTGFTDNLGCPQDLSVGLEGPAGLLGLTVFVESTPPDGYAIRFLPPETTTFEFVDIQPEWIQSEGSTGEFLALGDEIVTRVSITNSGNTSTDEAAAEISIAPSPSGVPVFSEDVTTAPPSFDAGESEIFSFPVTALDAGYFAISTTTRNLDDLNPANDTLSMLLSVVDLAAASPELGFNDVDIPEGGAAWTGGGLLATFMKPPVWPIHIEAIRAFVLAPDVTGAVVQLQILDDDGPDGSPGTVLASVDLTLPIPLEQAWFMGVLPAPITIEEGGFYVAYQHGADAPSLGIETAGGVSRNTWESVAGTSWSPYRAASTTDFLLRAMISYTAPVIPDPDGPPDSPPDAGMDGGMDAGLDASHDAASDMGVDLPDAADAADADDADDADEPGDIGDGMDMTDGGTDAGAADAIDDLAADAAPIDANPDTTLDLRGDTAVDAGSPGDIQPDMNLPDRRPLPDTSTNLPTGDESTADERSDSDGGCGCGQTQGRLDVTTLLAFVGIIVFGRRRRPRSG